MKALTNLGWMLLGVAVGSGAVYCYECTCNCSAKDSVNELKKKAGKEIENMMNC